MLDYQLDYQVVWGMDTYDLMVKVREQIEEGWLPQGGVNVTWEAGRGKDFHQAMVREVEDDE